MDACVCGGSFSGRIGRSRRSGLDGLVLDSLGDEGGRLLLAGAALLLMGEKGHEGDIGLRLVLRAGAGATGLEDAVGVDVKKLGAKRAGHGEPRVTGGQRGNIPVSGEGYGEEKWKSGRLGELSEGGGAVSGTGCAVDEGWKNVARVSWSGWGTLAGAAG